ncbi:expressed protein [Echinococcus multilocularis]|uniref:Expressed protein n=1 Tax=Echinococcus multilocularis TaxID=6211 RepID=A0A068Y644_ECHMU|nr:expressed protein [Echinococcus multilocularis]
MTDNQDNYTLKEYHERLKSIFKRLNRKYETVVVRASTKKKPYAEASEMMNTEWKMHPPRVTNVPDRHSKSFPTSISSTNLSFSSTSSSTSSSSSSTSSSSSCSSSHKPSPKIQHGQADFAKKMAPSMKKPSTKPKVKQTGETNPKAKASRPPARHDVNKAPPNCKTTFIAAKATRRSSYPRNKKVDLIAEMNKNPMARPKVWCKLVVESESSESSSGEEETSSSDTFESETSSDSESTSSSHSSSSYHSDSTSSSGSDEDSSDDGDFDDSTSSESSSEEKEVKTHRRARAKTPK